MQTKDKFKGKKQPKLKDLINAYNDTKDERGRRILLALIRLRKPEFKG